ncbi:MAG: hypothetical protein HFF80_01935 [Oscillospiraceae bacterium]|nr:hypothetical protein [Oscillospiraceae bacterium]
MCATEERENKRPILSDLGESGAFVPEADIVLFLQIPGNAGAD